MNKWVIGSRPRTLPAAIAPVLVGTALIQINGISINWFNALLALAVSLLLQIGVNYSNDYSDGIKGTDAERVGPVRLVASGLATAKQVKQAAYLTFFAACVAGLILSLRTSPWLILVGVISIIAAWKYTGGENPYGYKGFGEISVFVFFGIVATMGSYFAQSQKLTWQALLIAFPMGALACSLLAINNLRDLPKDLLVSKKTLAVRLGDKRARTALLVLLIVAQLCGALIFQITPWGLITLLSLPLTFAISKEIMGGASGKALIPLLGKTGKLQLAMALLITLALTLGRA